MTHCPYCHALITEGNACCRGWALERLYQAARLLLKEPGAAMAHRKRDLELAVRDVERWGLPKVCF